jgi:hypothetical protein
MNVSQLKHSAWSGVVLPLVLAVGSTFTGSVLRTGLLIAAIITVSLTYHHTQHGGKRWSRTGWVAGSCALLAIGVFYIGQFVDARTKVASRNTATAAPVVTAAHPPEQAKDNTTTPEAKKLTSKRQSKPSVATVHQETQGGPAVALQGNSWGGIAIAPRGIANTGTIYGDAIVNNGPSPTSIKYWRQEQTVENGKPTLMVYLAVDNSLDVPAFIALCDRPCKTQGASIAGASSFRSIAWPKNPRQAGFQFSQPRPLGSDIRVDWKIQSEDDQSVKISKVEILPREYVPRLPD